MSTDAQQLSMKRIWQAGGLAIVASVVANVIILLISLAILPITSDFAPLNIFPVAFFTTIGVLAATVVFVVVHKMVKDSLKVYRIIAVVALIISLIPNVALIMNPNAMPMPGAPATPLAVIILMVFHVVAAGFSIWFLTMWAVNNTE